MSLFKKVKKIAGRVGTGIVTGGISEIGRAVGGSKANALMDKVDPALQAGGLALATGGMLSSGLLAGGASAASAAGAAGAGAGPAGPSFFNTWGPSILGAGVDLFSES